MSERDPPLFGARGIVKRFPIRHAAAGDGLTGPRGALGRASRRSQGEIRAVSGVDLDIDRGEIVGLVGESGCGKSTLGRTIVRLLEPDEGTLTFAGRDITHAKERELGDFRRRVQIIFQDPHGSLNPRRTVGSILREAIRVHRIVPEPDVERAIADLLDAVGMPRETIERYPHELSGGQRQRVGIARALSVRPELIVADEPVSALDVSIRAQIINLLIDLQKRLGLALLFISHDLAVVRHISDRVLVMYLGRIVESLPSAGIRTRARHPYTRALLASAPLLPRRRADSQEGLEEGAGAVELRGVMAAPLGGETTPAGEGPDAVDLSRGCAFRPRCPRARASCAADVPALRSIGQAHALACPVVVEESWGSDVNFP